MKWQYTLGSLNFLTACRLRPGPVPHRPLRGLFSNAQAFTSTCEYIHKEQKPCTPSGVVYRCVQTTFQSDHNPAIRAIRHSYRRTSYVVRVLQGSEGRYRNLRPGCTRSSMSRAAVSSAYSGAGE